MKTSENPVSQWITNCGCIIQGVMFNESEINTIYCPVHKAMVHVYSFNREIDMRRFPTKLETKLAEELKQQYCRNLGNFKF